MGEKKQLIAIIDIGSNSIRLVVFSVDVSGVYKEVQNLKIVARLSSHFNHAGEITEKGIQTLVSSLKYFKEVITTYPISTLLCVATAAIRQAKNQKEIIHYVQKETNLAITVLTEYEEAFYGFLAVTNSTDYQNGLTIDIGGGSTEITLFKDRQILHYHSFPFGAISLKQKFIHNEIPSNKELQLLRNYIQDCFHSLQWLKQKGTVLIGIGGSARNLSLIQQRKINYPLAGLHQYKLKLTEISAINEQLINTSLKERQKIDGLSKDRADIIIPAVEVIKGLMDHAKTTTFIMSNKGLRDGLFYRELLSKMNIEQFPNVSERSIKLLMQEYNINAEHVNHICMLTETLFYIINSLQINRLTDHELRLASFSAKVREMGSFISPESSSQHTFYLLTNQTIDGLTHPDRLKIAAIASFKSRSMLELYLKPYKGLLTTNDIDNIELLGALLKFCSSLDITKQQLIRSIKLGNKAEGLVNLNIFSAQFPYFENSSAQKSKKHLEKSLKTKIELHYV